MKNTAPDWILSSIMAGGAFIASYLFFDVGMLISLVISALFFTSGALLFRTGKADAVLRVADFESSLLEGKKKLAGIVAFRKQIRDEAIIVKINTICLTVEKILVEVRRDPSDLKAARQFLSYYLDATINILNKYVTLSAQNVSDSGITSSLKRVESMLDTIAHAFEKQLTRLLSNDVMDLDTELSLLEKTIQMEGLGDEP